MSTLLSFAGRYLPLAQTLHCLSECRTALGFWTGTAGLMLSEKFCRKCVCIRNAWRCLLLTQEGNLLVQYSIHRQPIFRKNLDDCVYPEYYTRKVSSPYSFVDIYRNCDLDFVGRLWSHISMPGTADLELFG